MKKIGFIGTGIMGSAMAGHLLEAGYELSVYNRTKEKAAGLLAKGAKWCDSAGECARGQDAVISIVGYPKDVEESYLGSNGILANAEKGTYVIDMTTSSPLLAQKIYEAAQKKGIYAIDAPVTGGDTGAQKASLCILAGGDEAAFLAVKPLLAKMGSNIIYEGSAGAGQKTKACNQIAIAGALAGACEAFSYAQASGLDADKVFSAISKGAAGSFQMSNVVVNALKGNFEPGFMLKHFIKDMNIGIETGDIFSVNMPVLKQVLVEAKELEEKGMGEKGTQSLIKYYENDL
ncbi:NAD(P)-dependent oxidoreductase [Pectinatus haikarae]|uniref:3-hydroxyisobutyrate dehydrogenase-like beta-hydroxyacid dehydrogenase n=1 Tax=Pectinatus haikarae TaxID=349096 RepID=A0ABT9Y7Z8_9FIRM|nr:NAD(P)-dependent oxidoreductase [Pectinatus haikarae]MDQ0203960.1 3-hydroxyisobutyrate dehydrogenase-like beta-hydroxyacid dehydrogenase [Pectinatus haikarae]